MRKVLPIYFVPLGSKLRFIQEVDRRVCGKQKIRMAEYRCDCGGNAILNVNNVKRGLVKSCGCIVSPFPYDSIHTRSSRLRFINRTKVGHALYECECGEFKEIRITHVKYGIIQSCGCLSLNIKKGCTLNEKQKAEISKRTTTHGLSKHPLYRIYHDIIKRCENKKCKVYNLYGGRGVRMCDEWRNDFMSFFSWAIDNKWDVGLEIDKDIIPKKLGIPSLIYSPEMCSVVNHEENMNAFSNNINIEYNGVSKTIKQWANEYKVDYKLVWGRLKKGWNIHDALSLPIQKLRRKRIDK